MTKSPKTFQPPFPACYQPLSKPHKFCPGCGHPIALKMLGQTIDEMKLSKKVVFLIDIGCSLLAWDFFTLPTAQTHHGRTIPTAVGFKKADQARIVIAYVGDGGAYAIGLQNLISASLRNDPITTIVVNNTLYGMTGGQMAPTTLEGEITTTTPGGRQIRAHGHTFFGPETLRHTSFSEAFLARGSTEKPLVLKTYFRQALENQIRGQFSLVEALSVCPLNWKTNAADTIKRGLENEKIFPLGIINPENRKSVNR